MSTDATIYCEYRYEGGETWWVIAEFQIGSGASFYRALTRAGLAGRGLPVDLSGSVQIYYEPYAEFRAKYPNDGPYGETWFTTAELPLLIDAKLWLSERNLEIVPLHAYEGYAELDTIQAWQAFAQAHEASGSPVRFVVWFSN